MTIWENEGTPSVELEMASALLSLQTVLQTIDCKLNQSRWDVVSFCPPSSPALSPPPPPPKVYQEKFYAENARPVDVTPVRERELMDAGNGGDYRKTGLPANRDRDVRCERSDGRNWRCRTERAEGGRLCQYHLTQRISYRKNSNLSITKQSDQKMAGKKSERCTHPKKVPQASSSKPSDDIDYEDEEEEEDERDEAIGGHRRKKARKPIKFRSLKSLMG